MMRTTSTTPTIPGFHPAVWWVDQRVAVEREMACDDAVLAETRSPRAYAECLANLAEKSFVNRSIALAQAALGKLRQTSARLARILDVNRPAHASPQHRVAILLIATLTAGCGLLYPRAPRLVAFGGSSGASPQLSTLSGTSAPVFVRPDSRTENFNVPVIPATLHEPITLAKPNHKSNPWKVPNPDRVATLRPKSNETENNLIHLTGSESVTVPAVTETFWLVVESENSGPAASQVYHIQMWRVTVLRTVFTAPGRQTPRNET